MNLKKTPLNSEHKRMGAKMVDFGGWEMPVQYTSILEEHEAVREGIGVFDVSHMGEIMVEGNDVLPFVDHLIVNSVSKLKNGQICYSPMCYENGTIVDDLLAYRFSDRKILLVVNASNTDKDFEWIKKSSEKFNVKVSNLSNEYAQIAFQGPKAEEALRTISGVDLSEIAFYHFTTGRINGIECIISRTGYTGEDGFELYFDPQSAVAMWRKLLEIGKPYGVKACGLGARDTLRFEACYMLYGNDIDDTTTPLEAGLKWTVDFDKDFVGKEALLKQIEDGLSRRLKGLEISKGIARHGYKVFSAEDEEIGYITSGTKSPTLGKSLALAYLARGYTKKGTKVFVEIHGKKVSAQVVKIPFYRGSVKSGS